MIGRDATTFGTCPVPVFIDRPSKRDDPGEIFSGRKFPDFLTEIMLPAVPLKRS